MNNLPLIQVLLVLAGLGQLVLAVGSLVIPRVLGWREELAKLKPLTRQVFRTYSVYIWATNVSFGLLSAFAPKWLLADIPLARVVAGYVTLYWGARVAIQFVYYDRKSAPPGVIFKLAEVAMVGLFAGLTLLYGFIAISARAAT